MHTGKFDHIPLYHLMIPFAMKTKVTVTHRAGNLVFARAVKME